MTVKYQLFKIVSKELLVRSTDYYAKSGDSQEETVTVLDLHGIFDTPEEAVQYLEKRKEEFKNNSDSLKKYAHGDYTILPVYTI